MQSHCSCPSTFYGSRCEFAVEPIDLDTVDTEVGMEVSVNKEFSPDLNDNTSKAYRDFTDTFQDQMKKVYQNVQGFKEVVTLSLRNGIIVVNYLVGLELPFSLQQESEYEKVKVALKEELQNVSQNDNSCENPPVLYFKPDSIKVNNTRTELSPEAICRHAAAVGYEDFDFTLLKENKLRCVTKCSAGADGAIDRRQVQCVPRRRGTSCRCFCTDAHWVSGPRCEVAISWKALVGGPAGTAALLLLLVALSVFVARSWSRGGPGGGLSWDDRQWFETWDGNPVGTFSNSGFEDDRTNENSHVALENVDTDMMGDAGDPDPANGSLALDSQHCHNRNIRGGGCPGDGHPGRDLILPLAAKGVTLETRGQMPGRGRLGKMMTAMKDLEISKGIASVSPAMP
ncbi:mucin-3A [Kogia breviceps]|uniref:mucin-3A n=1 Tax=Kogia breviceps TaxID=27615 RepID=UPI0034D258D4